MPHLLQAILTFPSVVYTVLLGVVSLYWVSMLLGAVDLDLLGGAEHGGADGAADGHGHDVGDVGHAGDAGHTGDAGDAGDGDGGDGDADADDAGDHGGVFSALGAWGLRKVPVTVTVSLLVIYGWLVSVLGVVIFDRVALPVMSATIFNAIVLTASVVASFFLASLSARPLAPVFATRPAVTRLGLVGREGEVSTGRLDRRFGQVLVKDGGAGLIIDARHDSEGQLKRGDRVIITGWDADQNVAHVESVEQLTSLRVEARAERSRGEASALEKSADEPDNKGVR